LIGFGSELCRVFGEQFDSAAKFTFSLTGGNALETIKPLDYFAGRVVDMLIQKLVEIGPHTGLDEATRARRPTTYSCTAQRDADSSYAGLHSRDVGR
jgi:hypothetical protein